MKLKRLAVFLCTILAGCGLNPAHEGGARLEVAAAARSLKNTPIEECILELPPFRYHEEKREEFVARVRSARALTQNDGRSRDYLFVPGDGTSGDKEFSLDRGAGILVVKIGAADGASGGIDTWKKEPHGWGLMSSKSFDVPVGTEPLDGFSPGARATP